MSSKKTKLKLLFIFSMILVFSSTSIFIYYQVENEFSTLKTFKKKFSSFMVSLKNETSEEYDDTLVSNKIHFSIPDPSLLWSNSIGKYIATSIKVTDIDDDGFQELLTMSSDGFLYVFFANNGTLKWTFSIGDFCRSSFAIIDINNDGVKEIIFGAKDNRVYAISGLNGSVIWTFLTSDEINDSAPTVDDLNNDGNLEVVIGSLDNNIYALNGKDGSLFWNYSTGGDVRSSAVVTDLNNDGKKEVIFGSSDYNIYVLHGENGSLFWKYLTSGDVVSSPLVADIDNDKLKEIYIGGGGSHFKVYALYSNGSLIWSQSISGFSTMWSNVALGNINDDDILDVVVAGFYLYVFSGDDGSSIWSYSLGGDCDNSPLLMNLDSDTNQEIVIAGDTPIVRILDNNGTLLKTISLSDDIEYVPVIKDGDNDGFLNLYTVENNGYISNYNLSITSDHLGTSSTFRKQSSVRYILSERKT